MKILLIFECSDHPPFEDWLAPILALADGGPSRCKGATAAGMECLESAWTVAHLKLPWATGLGLITQLKHRLPRVGIVVTDAQRGVADCVQAYDNGADIFMNGPASEEELAAMSQAMMRRLGRHRLRAAAQGMTA